jgi:esterase/lipase
MANDSKERGFAEKLEHGLEYFIFASRWVQAPIYVALIFAAVAYAWKSVQELLHLLHDFATATESSIMLGILSLVDISMVANHADRIRAPLLIIQGKNDPRVPFTEAEQMRDAVKAKGGTVWYVMAKDEGHGFVKKTNADYQFAATILFLRAHLLD